MDDVNCQEILKSIAASSLLADEGSVNIVDDFLERLSQYHHRAAHNLQEMRIRDDRKIHGDIFEQFSKVYMQKKMKITNVWLLKEVPEDILEYLNLKRHDVGIDIVGLDDDGYFYACQAKYKDRGLQRKHKISVTWKEASTFFALVARTGPYEKYIVITTADYVRHMAPKTSRDLSICIGTLRRLTGEFFEDFCRNANTTEHQIEKYSETHSDIIKRQNLELEEALRADRLREKEMKNSNVPGPEPNLPVGRGPEPSSGQDPRQDKKIPFRTELRSDNQEFCESKTPLYIREARIDYFDKINRSCCDKQ